MTNDPMTGVRNDNRYLKIPFDIVIPTKYNLVDQKRFTVYNAMGIPVTSGPANYGQSVIETVQRAIDEQRITISGGSGTASGTSFTPTGNTTSTTVQDAIVELQNDIDNIDGTETVVTAGTGISVSGDGSSSTPYIISTTGTSSVSTFAVLLSDGTTTVQGTYYGNTAPECTLSGTNDNQVNIVTPSGTRLDNISVYASSTQLDASGNKTIDFSGAGLLGNESVATIYKPLVQKLDIRLGLGQPSTSNPYPYDIDNNPSMSVVGVGTSGNPQLTLRINSLSAFSYYNLTFKW